MSSANATTSPPPRAPAPSAAPGRARARGSLGDCGSSSRGSRGAPTVEAEPHLGARWGGRTGTPEGFVQRCARGAVGRARCSAPRCEGVAGAPSPPRPPRLCRPGRRWAGAGRRRHRCRGSRVARYRRQRWQRRRRRRRCRPGYHWAWSGWRRRHWCLSPSLPGSPMTAPKVAAAVRYPAAPMARMARMTQMMAAERGPSGLGLGLPARRCRPGRPVHRSRWLQQQTGGCGRRRPRCVDAWQRGRVPTVRVPRVPSYRSGRACCRACCPSAFPRVLPAWCPSFVQEK
eukprot:scaffold43886_cov61-Phaeocystis_antarctica.AAC.9